MNWQIWRQLTVKLQAFNSKLRGFTIKFIVKYIVHTERIAIWYFTVKSTGNYRMPINVIVELQAFNSKLYSFTVTELCKSVGAFCFGNFKHLQ